MIWAELLAAWWLHFFFKLADVVSSREEAARVEIIRALALSVAASHKLGILPHNLNVTNKVIRRTILECMTYRFTSAQQRSSHWGFESTCVCHRDIDASSSRFTDI